MRFNIVHNDIFIIIDDINNYIHKRVNPPESPPMPRVFQYADPRHFVIKGQVLYKPVLSRMKLSA